MVEAELSSVGLPVKDRGLMLETAEVLKKNIRFEWRGPQDWAGLTKKDLTELVVQIAAFIGITPQQAEKISIIFADQYSLPHNDSPCTGICHAHETNGTYSGITVIFNRSLEVLMENVSQNDAGRGDEVTSMKDLELYDPDAEMDAYYCELSPFEFVVWEISEELKHARVYLMAKSKLRYVAWLERYLGQLIANGNLVGDMYDIDLNEVAANRSVLRILTYISTRKKTKRYFRDCYLESLRTKRVFFPCPPETTFIQTGYKSSPLFRLVEIIKKYL